MATKWTPDKVSLLQVYINQGYTYLEVANKMGLSYDQIKHAIQRYNLTKENNTDLIFTPDKKKLRKVDVDKLATLLGEKIYENYKVVKLPVYKAKKSKAPREEVSILDISDTHIGAINQVFDSDKGKKVVTYNMDVFRKELMTLEQSIADIHSILSNSYKLRHLYINVMGDIVTNDRIFPEQTFEIEKVVGLQVWDAVNYFTLFFNNLLRVYDKITVTCVVGNHGRSQSNFYNEVVENNFEYFVYKTWQKQFADSKRIKIVVPDTRRYAYNILNWRHLIEHGDLMRGSSDNYLEKQIKDLSLNMGGFDVFHFGHFHKLKEREIADKVIVKQNGAWIPKDSYAYNKYKTYSVPKQQFFGCNSKRAETFSYKLDLRG